MIYLCSVYSLNLDNLEGEEYEALVTRRYEYVRKVTAQILKGGTCVFSPIAHCHDMSVHHDMPKEWEFWKHIDFQYLDAASMVWVLKMPNWEKSVGVTAEIEYAIEKGIPVVYIPCDRFGDTGGLG